MALTRASVEKVLIRRCGRLLAWANLDGTGQDGSNGDLADPIASALRACGVELADATDPADDDFLTLATADQPMLLDIAELRCLETIWGNLDEVTEQQGTDKQEWNQMKEGLRKRIQDKRKDVLDLYGYGGGALVEGSLTLAYTEPEPTYDDEEELP